MNNNDNLNKKNLIAFLGAILITLFLALMILGIKKLLF